MSIVKSSGTYYANICKAKQKEGKRRVCSQISPQKAFGFHFNTFKSVSCFSLQLKDPSHNFDFAALPLTLSHTHLFFLFLDRISRKIKVTSAPVIRLELGRQQMILCIKYLP